MARAANGAPGGAPSSIARGRRHASQACRVARNHPGPRKPRVSRRFAPLASSGRTAPRQRERLPARQTSKHNRTRGARQMSATAPVHQQLPEKIAEMLAEQEEPLRRKFCDWLAHWRQCSDPACRRAHACAGDPPECFTRRWSGCPGTSRSVGPCRHVRPARRACRARGRIIRRRRAAAPREEKRESAGASAPAAPQAPGVSARWGLNQNCGKIRTASFFWAGAHRFDWGLATGTLLNYHSANTARILPKRVGRDAGQFGGYAVAIGRRQRRCVDASGLASSAGSGTPA